MARRRHTRRRRHHRSVAVLYKLLSVVVISGAIVAALTLFFKVETITVSGTTEYSSEEIITASGIQQGDNLFLLNKYEIYEFILEKLPYVSSVSISRKLPDTLLIEVTDSNQGGVIEDHGTYWVLSAEGKILRKARRGWPRRIDHGTLLVRAGGGERGCCGGRAGARSKAVARSAGGTGGKRDASGRRKF